MGPNNFCQKKLGPQNFDQNFVTKKNLDPKRKIPKKFKYKEMWP